jgi:protein-disulfide isomerase
MANKKTNTNSSKFPIIAIISVVVLVIIGVAYLNQRPTTRTPATAINNASVPNAQVPNQALINASRGASPENFLGSETAPVIIEEFADYQCPACAQVAPTLKEINSIYGNRIKFVFRSFPLPSFDKSYDAAIAVEAAGLQDRNKFWEMHNQIFRNQSVWSKSAEYKTLFEEYAKLIGLDIDRFRNDIASGVAKSRVDADQQRGRSAGISSTPTVFINNVQVDFSQLSVSGLQGLINAELEKFSVGPK